jgi:hypothetical protein
MPEHTQSGFGDLPAEEFRQYGTRKPEALRARST